MLIKQRILLPPGNVAFVAEREFQMMVSAKLKVVLVYF